MRAPDLVIDWQDDNLMKTGPVSTLGPNSYLMVTSVPNYYRASLMVDMETWFQLEYITDDHGGMIFYRAR
jgi:hypothetical protein